MCKSYVLQTLSLLFAAVFVWWTHRKRALTLDGALTAAAVGLWVLWFAGPWWLVPLFFFFLSGTLLGRLTRGRSTAADPKHGKPRDYRQVLCNGGLYAILATWAPGPEQARVLPLLALTLAVSTADTWSSEVGQYFRQKTYDILRWRPVPVGLSGGVSLAGTLAGLAGGLAMGALGAALPGGYAWGPVVGYVGAGGFAGMVLDSLLGAACQARYQDAETGALSDAAGSRHRLVQGWQWMDNDLVNLLSNGLVVALWRLWVG